MKIRTIVPADDVSLAAIIRKNLEEYDLAIPGTAYFDPELDHLSAFYQASPQREYFVAVDDEDRVLGGVGIAEFVGDNQYAELQKLYLDNSVKGQGISYPLVDHVVQFAKKSGYHKLYLETYHSLVTAIHVYERTDFIRLPQPLPGSQHGTMDVFFLRDIL